jgi:hypothetical protein
MKLINTHWNRFLGSLKLCKFGLMLGRNAEQHVGEAHLHTRAVPLKGPKLEIFVAEFLHNLSLYG